MSSDREKLMCLKRLSEVERYIHQDKRDPVIVASVLQFILNEPEEEFLASRPERERGVVDNLKKKTVSGEIKWKLDTESSGLGYVECLMYPSKDASQYCEIVKDAYGARWKNIRYLLLCDKDAIEADKIDLTDDDKKFFLAVFEVTATEKKVGLVDRFSK